MPFGEPYRAGSTRRTRNCCPQQRSPWEKSPKASACKAGNPQGPNAHSANETNCSASVAAVRPTSPAPEVKPQPEGNGSVPSSAFTNFTPWSTGMPVSPLTVFACPRYDHAAALSLKSVVISRGRSRWTLSSPPHRICNSWIRQWIAVAWRLSCCYRQ